MRASIVSIVAASGGSGGLGQKGRILTEGRSAGRGAECGGGGGDERHGEAPLAPRADHHPTPRRCGLWRQARKGYRGDG